ncbi:hypothetical protein [Moorena sp. SIO3B2]|nr:hypothetical protein [Moorena sp. SIO3B2]NEP36488.1 hypothetical protein [Moorena sp. SIO3B2]
MINAISILFTLNHLTSNLAFGHATRTNFKLGLWPRYANKLQTSNF